MSSEHSLNELAILQAQQAADDLHRRAQPLGGEELDLLFLEARSHNGWRDQPVSDEQLKALYRIVRMGPTSMNCSPARFIFIRSAEGKQRLLPAMSQGNLEKTESAPVIVIIAYDLGFPDHLPQLFPHTDAKRFFAGRPEHIATTAFRNGTLQGAYLLIAARALGLDCGPMSGFDHDKVDAEFFAGTSIKSNFICALGSGDNSKLFPRHPRLLFAQACELI